MKKTHRIVLSGSVKPAHLATVNAGGGDPVANGIGTSPIIVPPIDPPKDKPL
jgi:hypothetical protein